MNLIQTHRPQSGFLELFEYGSAIKGFMPAYDCEMEIYLVKLRGWVEGNMRELLFGKDSLFNHRGDQFACELLKGFIALVSL